jgi:hypothetical protein
MYHYWTPGVCPPRKDTDTMGMATPNPLAAIEADIEVLETRLATLKAQRERLATPPEPPSGSVVKFTVQHDAHGMVYRYSALNIDGVWFTTAVAANRQRLTWRKLLELMRKDFSVKTGADRLHYQVCEPHEFRMVTV